MLSQQIIKNKLEKKAFTLIEVITILFIISLGMIGVLSLIVQNIQSQSLNKNTLIAYQLAQEGIEMIREVRDTNWREARPWRTKLDSGIYYMDYTETSSGPHLAPTENKSYGNLKQDANGMYKNNLSAGGSASGFSRLISIKDYDGGIQVKSTIYWSDHGREYVYYLETLLYNWR